MLLHFDSLVGCRVFSKISIESEQGDRFSCWLGDSEGGFHNVDPSCPSTSNEAEGWRFFGTNQIKMEVAPFQVVILREFP